MQARLTSLGLLLVVAMGAGAQAKPDKGGMAAGKTSGMDKKSGMQDEKLTWGPAPAVFPKGAKMAVVSGDPGKAAMFTIQLSMPDGYKIMPHNHPTDESVEVIKGSFLVGMGDAFDAAKANAMAPGGKGTIKAKMNHYAATKGATVIAVSAMGPFAMTYVNPADDPQKMAKP